MTSVTSMKCACNSCLCVVSLKDAIEKNGKYLHIIIHLYQFGENKKQLFDTVKKHGKCLIVTEEQQNNSFAEALAGRISHACFKYLDMPVEVLGALNLPAVPMNIILEKEMLPNADKVAKLVAGLLQH